LEGCFSRTLEFGNRSGLEDNVITIGFFRECGNGLGSLLEVLDGCPISVREKVADYLDAGHALMATSCRVDDVIDSKNLKVAALAVLNDGRWTWPAVFGYYVRTYGVSVPAEFLAHVVSGATVPELSMEDFIEIEKSLANEGLCDGKIGP
jgi:hypothetical protein